jgi:predicted phage terminase large subunit-like protein
VLQKEGWEVLSFPAIAEDNECFDIQTPYGPRTFRRATGALLHPLRESETTLARMRAQMGAPAFLAQYQQAPCPRDGAMVKASWFPRYAAGELPAKFDLRLLSCDTANKASELSDFSALTVWGMKDGHFWLLSVLRRRMEYPELRRTIIEMAAQHSCEAVLIEDRASGTQLIQDLRGINGVPNVHACEPAGDKRMRLWAQTATMEQGLVHWPKEAPWLDTYVRELTSFPNSRFDDQVDSTTQALAWGTTKGKVDPWFARLGEWIEQRKLGSPEPFTPEWTKEEMVRKGKWMG